MRRPRAHLYDDEHLLLLRDEPELLAIADAVSATQRGRRRIGGRRVAAAALLTAVLVVALVFGLTWPGGGRVSVLDRALAAVSSGPVVHSVVVTPAPDRYVVDLRTGQRTPVQTEVESWFDPGRGELHAVTRRNGIVTDDTLDSPRGTVSSAGPVLQLPGHRPTLDRALAGFPSAYRNALASGEARVVGEGIVAGRRVEWLEFDADPNLVERVAVDRSSFAPILVRTTSQADPGSTIESRVTAIETVGRAQADFSVPEQAGPQPSVGNVVESQSVSPAAAAEAFAQAPLWLGRDFHGLSLQSIRLETLATAYPEQSGRPVEHTRGLHLVYGDEAGRRLDLREAPRPELAYAFPGGTHPLTFGSDPIPASGSLEVLGAGPFVGQLRQDGLYLTIRVAGEDLLLAAAASLQPLRS